MGVKLPLFPKPHLHLLLLHVVASEKRVFLPCTFVYLAALHGDIHVVSHPKS